MKQAADKPTSHHRVSTRLPTTKTVPTKSDPRKHPAPGYAEPQPTKKNIQKGPNPRRG